MTKLYEDPALVKIIPDGDWLRLRIRKESDNWARSFLMSQAQIQRWLSEAPTCYLEMDCGNLLRMSRCADTITLTLYWMNSYSDGRFTGRADTVCLRQGELEAALEGRTVSVLSHRHRFDRPSRFDFSSARDTLRRVVSDPAVRRALSKALARHADGWCGEHIRAFNDFGKSFYLVTTLPGGFRYDGGLVLHEVMRNGQSCRYYGFHT